MQRDTETNWHPYASFEELKLIQILIVICLEPVVEERKQKLEDVRQVAAGAGTTINKELWITPLFWKLKLKQISYTKIDFHETFS